jgi:hypothetical protein
MRKSFFSLGLLFVMSFSLVMLISGCSSPIVSTIPVPSGYVGAWYGLANGDGVNITLNSDWTFSGFIGSATVSGTVYADSSYATFSYSCMEVNTHEYGRMGIAGQKMTLVSHSSDYKQLTGYYNYVKTPNSNANTPNSFYCNVVLYKK